MTKKHDKTLSIINGQLIVDCENSEVTKALIDGLKEENPFQLNFGDAEEFASDGKIIIGCMFDNLDDDTLTSKIFEFNLAEIITNKKVYSKLEEYEWAIDFKYCKSYGDYSFLVPSTIVFVHGAGEPLDSLYCELGFEKIPWTIKNFIIQSNLEFECAIQYLADTYMEYKDYFAKDELDIQINNVCEYFDVNKDTLLEELGLAY